MILPSFGSKSYTRLPLFNKFSMICKHYPTILSYFIQVKSWSSWFCLVYFASSLKTLGRYGYSLNSFFILGSNIFSFSTASVYVFIFCWFDSFFLGWKQVCRKSAKRYVFTEFPSVSSRLSWDGKRLSLRREDQWKFSMTGLLESMKWTSGF